MPSCNPDSPDLCTRSEVQITFEPRMYNSDFEVEQVYPDGLGHLIRVDGFQCYFSKIELVGEDGSVIPVRDFFLANFQSQPSISLKLDAGKYTSLRFNVGIPPEYNKNVDPTTYPNNHPLSVQGSEGMFWFWNTGYIFTKFEGKANLEGVEGNPLLSPFAFHCGDDPLLRHFSRPLSKAVYIPGGNNNLRIIIHVDKILNGLTDQINIEEDFLTHTSGNYDLAERFMDNFSAALELQE